MRPLFTVVAALGIFLVGCRANLFDYVADIPPCGLECLTKLIPVSACQTFTNETCICTDQNLYSQVAACVDSSCTAIESLSVARIEAEACGQPIRSRKAVLSGIVAVEVFTLFCILLRLWARWRQDFWRLDDYLMLVMLVIFVPFTVTGQYARIRAFGVDIWTLNPDLIALSLQLFFIDETLYLVLLPTSKILLLVFYLRIFPNQKFRLAVYITMGFVASSGITFLFAQIFQCIPINYNWESWKGDFGEHKCVQVNTLVITAAAFSICQDLIILALPLPLLIGLHASWRKKSSIILMFSLGIFVTITSCIRLRYIIQFIATTNPNWDFTDTIIWTALEVNVAIIVSCLPAMRAYFVQVMPRIFASAVGKSAKDYPSSLRFGSDPKRFQRSKSSSVPPFSDIMSRSVVRDPDAESQIELGLTRHEGVTTRIEAPSQSPSPDLQSPDHRDDGLNGSRDRETAGPLGVHVTRLVTVAHMNPKPVWPLNSYR